jgi:hypothetical protein
VLAVCGASGSWGRLRRLLLFLPPPPDGSMMKGHGPMQPDRDNPNHGWHTAHLDDPLDGRRGLRAPSTSMSTGQGKGPLQHTTVWCGQRRRRWWRCRANNCVTVATTITTTATVVAWAGDFVKKYHDEISKYLKQHLTEFLLFDLSFIHFFLYMCGEHGARQWKTRPVSR